eukprot:10498414-Ditylum_brightwellii.AAC.1
MKQVFQQMKLITKGMTGGVFQYAQPFKVLDDQNEVMSVLAQWNKLHLHQAFDTPFAKKKLKDYIGEFSTSCGVQEIHDGQFHPNNFKIYL